MRQTYLTIGTVTFIIGLIIAFENFVYPGQMLILFWRLNTSLFFPLIMIFSLGMVSGFFFALARGVRSKRFDDMDI